ncbi:hypothetical protein A3I51_02925 [Candidatus Gottesmanbacteria bacterium RIFCSPLOWO2_02_FULL_38_8]|uniref:Aspartate/glutamate/uridylate kinase domain-containing protein n=1 Tax=Candidatus Gottesmanbacteria bacterium RIFCSPLOWO2_02_FULL_38_8 TaxID=1798397 RepID=A0A1F6B4Z1_9BACT|nr:MAG: hypothetical protein A3I51_02925 [Candidatus Gottesmanbacteria bacterium RIFCSPLOWO2_02_FULL_38_8]
MGKIMKIIIIKIGSSILLTKRNKLDELRIVHIAEQICKLKERLYGAILVVSGAVAYGANFIDISGRNIKARQAAAGIGQVHLTSVFQEIFIKKNLQLAQILLAKEVLSSIKQQKLLRQIIKLYLKTGVIPLFNENDVIDLNCFGGNDFLAAKLTELFRADQLLILSSREGSKYGIGGGQSKQAVIKSLSNINIKAEIIDGKKREVILKNVL